MHHDFPEYVLKQNSKRVFAQVIVEALVMLTALYYVLILLVRMWGYPLSRELQFSLVLFLFLLFCTEMLLTLNRARNTTYTAYSDRIVLSGKKPSTVQFSEVHSISFKHNIFDKMFHTTTILLNSDVQLKALEANNQLIFSLQKLIQRGKQEHVALKPYSTKLAFGRVKMA